MLWDAPRWTRSSFQNRLRIRFISFLSDTTETATSATFTQTRCQIFTDRGGVRGQLRSPPPTPPSQSTNTSAYVRVCQIGVAAERPGRRQAEEEETQK